ncbi:hypothetical protein [Streptomyces sp. MP131-18]|uniref:hypothetical protein n=1 Tax=Streptomyces sp. MP131-18 TaxID=1857892 RepID=UPI00097C0727|nr:hypothetical protein [Streptomyces sp. MP131-18]ONK13806.1 hypothetical protein STBA_45790 [Streptomyces sp. MP131-18]
MYGPPPLRPRTGARALVVRWLFALFPIGSLGLLAWVPSLRFAVLRGRGTDWAVFCLFCSLTVAEVVLISAVPDDESNLSAFAGFYALAYLVGATVHAVRADRFPRRAAVPPGHVPPPPAHRPVAPRPHPGAAAAPRAASPRMRQVASELDELGALLRRQEGR